MTAAESLAQQASANNTLISGSDTLSQPSDASIFTQDNSAASEERAEKREKAMLKARKKRKMKIWAAVVGITLNVVAFMIMWPNRDAIRQWLIELMG